MPFDDGWKAQIEQRYEAWSQQGFRVLGVASKQVTPKAVYVRDDEEAMAFAGFLLFFDPPKPGVKDTISDLAELGVQLKIITGDNKLVAQHMAQEVGLELTGVLTGHEMGEMRDEALWQAVEHTNLFTEVDPNEKERIILALKKRATWWAIWATASTTRPRSTRRTSASQSTARWT